MKGDAISYSQAGFIGSILADDHSALIASSKPATGNQLLLVKLRAWLYACQQTGSPLGIDVAPDERFHLSNTLHIGQRLLQPGIWFWIWNGYQYIEVVGGKYLVKKCAEGIGGCLHSQKCRACYGQRYERK